MKYYLCLLVLAVCEAKRTTRGVGFTHYPDARTVYHGHGAVSYQNVQIDHHENIPLPANYIDQAELQELEHAHHHSDPRPFIPIEEPNNEIDYDITDTAPLDDFLITDFEIKPDVVKSFNHYDDEYNYDLHK